MSVPPPGVAAADLAVRARAAALLCAALLVGMGVSSCGQEDPTFVPKTEELLVGSLVVSSSVPGADIFLDSERTRKKTPATLDSVLVGEHVVSVTLPGYEIGRESVMVEADSVHELTFELVLIQEPGSVAVETLYPELVEVRAEILLDGIPTGVMAPDTLHSVQAGDHTISLRAPGFAPEPAEISLLVLADQVVDAAFEVIVPKLSLCEDFSNFACAPCPAADEALHGAIIGSTRRAISINPHAWWPGAGDPFYLFNPLAQRARVFLIGVTQLPTILVNGNAVAEPEQQAQIEALIAAAPERAPIAIGVEGRLAGNAYAITVDLWGVERDLPGEFRLFTCIVETEITLDPPGPNGQADYVNVLRELLPPSDGSSPGGELLSLAPGEHRTFDYSYALPAGGINPNHLGVIAFAQVPGSFEVLQAGSNLDH